MALSWLSCNILKRIIQMQNDKENACHWGRRFLFTKERIAS